MDLIKWILSPFSVLYQVGTSVRNFLYDSHITKSSKFDIKTIGVGNLRVGGTGKTPHVEYLIRLLKDQYQIATLSRGYGRKTKGFLVASSQLDASDIGDEPMQMYQKFNKDIIVTVGEKRALAIPKIKQLFPHVDLILMDDVFQHRAVSPDCNILLTEYGRPFYSDYILPSGRLRESRSGAKRADIILVTKCPDKIEESELKAIQVSVQSYSQPGVPLFFTGIKYGKPTGLGQKEMNPGRKVLLVSGIANPEKFEQKVGEKFELVSHLRFADHFSYNSQTIKDIIKQFHQIPGKDKCIILTEKDMVKWKSPELEELYKDLPVFYLPIEIYFLKDKPKFDGLIHKMLEG